MPVRREGADAVAATLPVRRAVDPTLGWRLMAAPGALLALALWALCAPRGGALAFHVQALGLLALAGVAVVRCSGLLRAGERLGAVKDGRTAVSVRALEALAARARLHGAAAMGLCALAAFLLARAP